MKKIAPVISLYFIIVSCSNMQPYPDEEALNTPPQPLVVTSMDLPIEVATPMAQITKGTYVPLYGRDSQKVVINDINMDVYPVSNSDYLAFVKINMRWRKSKIKKIFTDSNYLLKWSSDTTLGVGMDLNSPVTNVSWFAAKAYCECQRKRLPTVDEWEYVAMADKNLADARKISSYNQYILDWYEKPKTFSDVIGKTFKNYWGIYDLHGLVWEWTADFNSILLSGESRNDVTTDNNLFCGSGSLKATDLMNYAAFMRYAFRGSVKANYAVQSLGFRCVTDTITTIK